jgi:hypothetical protein
MSPEEAQEIVPFYAADKNGDNALDVEEYRQLVIESFGEESRAENEIYITQDMVRHEVGW